MRTKNELAALRAGLVKAKSLIDHPSKWGKGLLSGRPNTHCAESAVEAVFFDSGYWKEPKGELEKELPAGHVSVYQFNDTETTTHADIMALFDRAIAKLDIEEFSLLKDTLPAKGAIDELEEATDYAGLMLDASWAYGLARLRAEGSGK